MKGTEVVQVAPSITASMLKSSTEHHERRAWRLLAAVAAAALLIVGVVFVFEVQQQVQTNRDALFGRFEGFINYGTPIASQSTDSLGMPVTLVLTESRIEQPIFSSRRGGPVLSYTIGDLKWRWHEWTEAAKEVVIRWMP